MTGTKQKNNLIIGVVGLGYVGLPLALEFAKKKVEVIGFDINRDRIEELCQHFDASGELSVKELKKGNIRYTFDPKELQKTNFIIIAIPTPVNHRNKPDLSLIKKASQTVGENLDKGSIVVYESTVWPGLTEEICVPLIEKASGLKCGKDWFIGYSPERVNPGDKKHTIDKVVKIVSGRDKKTLKKIAKVYRIVCQSGVYEAPNMATAEMAKVFENIQRDINIALINELALICHKLDIKTNDVLIAAGTKWNFLKFRPGLVGGHCVGVDPYYLLEKARKIGHHSQVITAGRRINDYMPKYIAEETIKSLTLSGKPKNRQKILILGLTFKENVRDTRNSKITVTIAHLQKYGAKIDGFDPNLSSSEISEEFNVTPVKKLAKDYDAVVVNVAHRQFIGLAKKLLTITTKPQIIIDVPGLYAKELQDKSGIIYRSL